VSGKTILIVGGAIVGGYFLVRAFAAKPAPFASTGVVNTLPGQQTVIAAAGLIGGGLGAVFRALGADGGVPAETPVPLDTATSNYIADATALSDSKTGTVGFGGWN
jgi:hypothetical protein